MKSGSSSGGNACTFGSVFSPSHSISNPSVMIWDQSTGFSMTEHTPGKSADSRDHLSYDPAFASFQAMTAAAARSAASTAPAGGASPPRGSSTSLISFSARIAFFSATSAGASSASTIPRRPV